MPALPSRTAGVRARQVREERGISTQALADELVKAGVPWSERTVEEFEEGRRNRLDIQELLAIAIVLSVPPIALLVDPSMPTTAVAPGVEVPTAYALLWLLGEQPLHGMTGTWQENTVVMRLIRQLHDKMWLCLNANEALHAIERLFADGFLNKEEAQTRRNAQERLLFRGLNDLRHTLNSMRAHEIAVPRLVEQELLVVLARHRGMGLDVQAEAPRKQPEPELAHRRRMVQPRSRQEL